MSLKFHLLYLQRSRYDRLFVPCFKFRTECVLEPPSPISINDVFAKTKKNTTPFVSTE